MNLIALKKLEQFKLTKTDMCVFKTGELMMLISKDVDLSDGQSNFISLVQCPFDRLTKKAPI